MLSSRTRSQYDYHGGGVRWTSEMLEEWWKQEYAKIKPLDSSYFAFTFDPNTNSNTNSGNRRIARTRGKIIV